MKLIFRFIINILILFFSFASALWLFSFCIIFCFISSWVPFDLKYFEGSKTEKQQIIKNLILHLAEIEKINYKTNKNKLCEIICNPSDLELQESRELVDYFKEHKEKAFTDPLFSLRLEKVNSIANIITPEIREAIFKVLEFKATDFNERLLMANQLNILLISNSIDLYKKLKTFKVNESNIQSIKNLRKNCKTQKASLVKTKCFEIMSEKNI